MTKVRSFLKPLMYDLPEAANKLNLQKNVKIAQRIMSLTGANYRKWHDSMSHVWPNSLPECSPMIKLHLCPAYAAKGTHGAGK